MARSKRIIGASRLKRKLKRMPEEISAEIKKVIRDEANGLLKDIRSLAPVSGESNPMDYKGRPRVKLRDAFEARIAKDGLTARIGIMGKRKKSQFFFVKFLEFGTRFIEARPFIGPTWTRRKNGTRLAIKNAVIRALRRTANLKVSDV